MTLNPGYTADTLELSPAARAYVDSLPVRGGPQAVLRAYASTPILPKTEAERREDEARRERLSRRQDLVDDARVGLNDGFRDVSEVLCRFEIACAAEERKEETQRLARAEERATRAETFARSYQRQLVAERRRAATAQGERRFLAGLLDERDAWP